MICIMKVGGALNVQDTDTDYYTGEGHFDDGSNKPSGAATPIEGEPTSKGKGKKPRIPKKAKTAKARLMMADGDVDMS
jgi:DNA helicase INO80